MTKELDRDVHVTATCFLSYATARGALVDMAGAGLLHGMRSSTTGHIQAKQTSCGLQHQGMKVFFSSFHSVCQMCNPITPMAARPTQSVLMSRHTRADSVKGDLLLVRDLHLVPVMKVATRGTLLFF